MRQYLFPKVSKHLQKILLINLNYRYIYQILESIVEITVLLQSLTKIVGAVWVRIMNDYGHVDNETPSFAISLFPEYRNHGIGTALMKSMIDLLKTENISKHHLPFKNKLCS